MNQAIARQEEIFMKAIEIEDSEAQQEFLDNACRGDLELLQKLNRMLKLHFRQDNVLDCNSDGLFQNRQDEDESSLVGTEVGPYKLLQQIGAGGMGVVFMAQQTTPVRRTVAVKIVKRGIDSRNVIARFESERQALAIMDHPSITKFLDAGLTESGRPYFVMELITGMPITKFSDDRKLGPRQRMELFSSVCSAIQHAHRKGVIHRDIKPSNIMVTEFDGKAVPKIIDFGIAKAINDPLTEKTLFTSYGKIVGTPEYMSPEQAEMNGLDVDTSSDVYSLGVVLYELMTGTTPLVEHKKNGLLKFCDAICNVEPELASTCANNLMETTGEVATNRNIDHRTLRQFLKGDVDWILAKCLAKRREDRYATAAALADDVERCLAGESVLAGAPSKSYRLKKFFFRNRFAVAIALVLATSMLVATFVSLAFAARATNAEQLANMHLRQSQESQQLAESERDRALAAEARIRELERASRLEASSAQAVVRYRNQENAADPDEPISSTDDKSVVEEKLNLQIEVASNGNISMTSEDGEFTFEFVVRSQGSSMAKSTRLRIQELEPAERVYAYQVLSLVTDELRKRFGHLDLFVAEPKLLLAEMEMEDGNWRVAAEHVRQNARLFVNNYSHRGLKARNQLLLATILAKQDVQSREAIKLLRKYHDYLLNEKDISEPLSNVLTEIGRAFDEEDRVRQGECLDAAISKLLTLKDIVLTEVFESMEWELQKREAAISSR
ncbi:serine/threonine protein kinase [bacterium]|nr:serine/threonine protein kinase [bacterium]